MYMYAILGDLQFITNMGGTRKVFAHLGTSRLCDWPYCNVHVKVGMDSRCVVILLLHMYKILAIHQSHLPQGFNVTTV